MYFSINPCSSSKRTWMYLQTLSWRSRYFVGERPSQPDMMWWMVSFSTRQIRHVSSSSILKTCFLICLVEIACSWMAATVDSVDLFSVEDFSHWLDALCRHEVGQGILQIAHSYAFFWVPPPVFWYVQIDGDFPRQFPHRSQLLNITANFITISLCLLVDRFFSSPYLPVWC